jgi:hypothetical protein
MQRRQLAAMGLVALGALSAFADSPNVIRSSSVRPPLIRHPEARAPRPNPNQHLISPMGSATGVPPGYYSQLLSQPSYGYAYDIPAPLPTWPPVIYLDQPTVPPPPAPVQPIVIINQVQAAPPVIIERAAPEPPPPPEPEKPRAPRPTAPQSIYFDVVPVDAVLRLDGRRLGTAAELGSREQPLNLTPGVYILQVEHPAHALQRLVFGVSESAVRVRIDLEIDDPMQRARVQ